jgi:hypothetical protein
MRTTFRTLWALFPACIAAVALVTLGCSDSTTHKDVAKAKQNLDESRQKTADAMQEGQKGIANAQQDAREHMVAKPVTPEENAKAQQDVAVAKEKERAAAAELKTKEQQFQATQERDAFVKQAELKLADYDKRIDELKQRASAADAANKDAINRQIDTVKNQRDLANKALGDLKGADLATWKNHQDHVSMAFQELDNSMKNVR